MSDNKVGLAEVFVSSGWPVDRQTSEYAYTQVEHVPVMEEYDAPAYIHTETYTDLDGEIRTREWTEFERRTRQIGVDEYRHDRTGSNTTFRIRYDHGRTTKAFSLPLGMSSSTRWHWVTIRHPLLRFKEDYWITGDGVEHGRYGIWRRLITARAAAAVRRHVADDRRAIMAGIGDVSRTIDPTHVREGWSVFEGAWNASANRLHTSYGHLRLPGPTHQLKDGELVIATVDMSAKLPFVEQWIGASMDRRWRRIVGSPARYVRRWWRAAALIGAGTGLAGYGLLQRELNLVIIGTAVIATMLYAIFGSEKTIYDRYNTRSRILNTAADTMRLHLWIRARTAHDRKIGWTK